MPTKQLRLERKRNPKTKLQKRRKMKELIKLLWTYLGPLVQQLFQRASSTEERSPFLETGTGSKRVNFLGAAKKASIFRYPSLGEIHETVEEMPVETVREQVLKACTAKTSEASPVMKGIIYKNKNGVSGSTEKCIADTGCSFSIINSQIVHKLNIKVRPFNHPINIIEASGNSLNLERSAKFYIKVPQVLGEDQFYPMEAAVLSGNQTDSELLISLDLLIEWNLVPKNFPNITLDEHFKQLMTNKHFNRKYSSL